MKYYAVKAGRETGLFRSWDECRKQVEGYSGAQFKSFKSLEDAERYLHNGKGSGSEAKSEDPNDPNAIEVYVDGSYQASLGVYAYGCVILTENPRHLSGVGTDPARAALRNVAGELLGTMTAIEWAVEHRYQAVVIYHDYAGIANWATGEWQARNEVTRAYVAFIKKYQRLIDIRFEKVKAHSGNLHNDEADQLAKQALEAYAGRES